MENTDNDKKAAGAPSALNVGLEIKIGDFFTHDRSKNTFVCCAITRRDIGISIELNPYIPNNDF